MRSTDQRGHRDGSPEAAEAREAQPWVRRRLARQFEERAAELEAAGADAAMVADLRHRAAIHRAAGEAA